MTRFVGLVMVLALLAGCPRGANTPKATGPADSALDGMIAKVVEGKSRPIRRTIEDTKLRMRDAPPDEYSSRQIASSERTLAALKDAGVFIRPKAAAWLRDNPAAPESEKLRIITTFLDDRLNELGFHER